MPSSLPERPRSVVIDWDVLESLDAAVDRPFLESVLVEAMAGRDLGGPVSVGLVITDDGDLQQLNSEHRGIDAPTDVLSFPLQQYEAPEKRSSVFPQPPGEPLPLGDIAISYQRAVEQAQSYGHSLDRELAFLVVHGAMHLLGYDHEDPADQRRMRQEEESVLSRIGLGRGSDE